MPFLNREEELRRIRGLFSRPSATLGVVYGRRRCGKSRLLLEALPRTGAIYFVGDDREPALQRAAVAARIAALMPGFDRAIYPDWDALLERFWTQAPAGTVLVLDEFPALVAGAPELPSLVQKRVDQRPGRRIYVVLAGSSQRMMQGLVLDRTAPLYGRALEILRIAPLAPGWIGRALRLRSAVAAVEGWSVWGGIPRYWELARAHPTTADAIKHLVLSPLGVLHDEPAGLLLDDLRDTTQAASILSAIGQGARRVSEIGARLDKPMTALARPLHRLLELDLVRRDTPFGESPRDSKRALYEIADPFLRFWFRFVEPQRSRLQAGQVTGVWSDINRVLAHHIAGAWEELARGSVPHLPSHGFEWQPASRWWGAGLDRRPMELDVVASSTDGRAMLIGEAKWRRGAAGSAADLARRAARCPETRGRRVCLALWMKHAQPVSGDIVCYSPADVLAALR